MNKLLSINNKFFKLTPENFLKIIDEYNFQDDIQGFECFVTTCEEMQYIKKLIYLANNRYIFNLHSPCLETTKENYEYIDFAIEISKNLNKKINIVYHPASGKNKIESIENTRILLDDIFKKIYDEHLNSYINVSIENLNDLNSVKRLKKEDFKTLFYQFSDLKFTYDIGHEIVDGIQNDVFDDLFKDRLSNVHIHTFDRISKIDHYPIENLNDEKEIKLFLEKYGNNTNIVLEYALDYIDGINFEEKIKNYIEYSKIICNVK